MGVLPSNYVAAIGQWRAHLGPAAADTSDATLARYARSTSPGSTFPFCVVRPTRREDVPKAMRIAHANGVPVHPIARGKNWGYGDACAPGDAMAILDLSGLNKISDLDTELGYVVIEPGVSQGQLYDYLQEHAPGFWMDSTGAGREASVLGNALQRGFGHTPYADHVRSICGLEVVLADGTVVETGFGHFGNARATHCYPYGLGPFIDGLFTQSNLGIVTRVGLWLMPKAERFAFFWVSAEEEERLPALIDALRPLRLAGVLRSAVHVGNDFRIMSSERNYPFAEAKGKFPMPGDLRERYRRLAGCGRWNAAGAFVGNKEEVKGGIRRLRQATKGLGRTIVLTDRHMVWLKRLQAFLRWRGWFLPVQHGIESLEHNFGLLQGRPTETPLRGMLWRVRAKWEAEVHDILDTKAGLLWLAPVLPLRGADAREVMDIVEPIFTRHGFDLPVTFTLLNERSMVGIMNVSYDRGQPEECAAAQRCHDEAYAALAAAGFYPYRESSLGHAPWFREGDTFYAAASAIKRALDPKGIISPGLYVP